MRIIHCSPFNLFTKVGGCLYSNPVKISMGLIENGHYVHNFDYRDTSRYYSIIKSKSGGIKKMNSLFKTLINDIKPDLIIFGHAELIDEEIFYEIKRRKIKMIFWYNDMIIDSLFKKVGHLFDSVFITGAGKIIDELKVYNQNSFFLPNPVNKNIEKYQGYLKKQEFDLLFSGRKDADRKDLINYIENNFNKFKLKTIGQTPESIVIGDEYFSLIQNSKICLNHSRTSYKVNKWYTSDRLMHILGNGSFCLSRKIIDGEFFFEDKLDYYETEDELYTKVLYYIENEDERIKKTEWLYNRTHSLFNTKKVSSFMIDILKKDDKTLNNYEWYE